MTIARDQSVEAPDSLIYRVRMATTSFRKKTVSPRHQQHPKGTRPSLHNAQLLVSTGVASLDALLGIVRLPDTHALDYVN